MGKKSCHLSVSICLMGTNPVLPLLNTGLKDSLIWAYEGADLHVLIRPFLHKGLIRLMQVGRDVITVTLN